MNSLLAAELIDLHPQPADLRRLVRAGMARMPRQLPAWLLYDEEGSRLFERICGQPEYSLTRTETALLQEQAQAIAAALPTAASAALVEFGAGNARKAGPLLEALRPAAYAALDISAVHLEEACRRLQRAHAGVPVLGICCDYSVLTELPAHGLLQGRPCIGFYPGSSIGNFTPREAIALLAQFRRLLGATGQLLIGIDHPKERSRLEAAYDDAAGVSAAFARNLLVRLNRDLEGDFRPEAFRYEARWQPAHSRIAMALVSRQAQAVRLAGQRWEFDAGQPLISEYSVKYSRPAFAALAAAAGWRPVRHWSDPAADLSLLLLRGRDSIQSHPTP